MELTAVPSLEKRKKADALVLPYWKEHKSLSCAIKSEKLSHLVDMAIESGDFTAKEGETAIIYVEGQPEARIILLGLGDKEKASVERLRRAYASLVPNFLCEACWKACCLQITDLTF
jgi:leucyl aminopeptidase